jgi:mono/diheme cytochrome c family protein
LPELTTPVAAFRVRDGELLSRGEALTLEDARPIDAQVLPTHEAGWQALGAQVFNGLPMRGDAWLDWLLAHPERWAEVGIEPEADGTVRGLVRYAAPNGAVRVAMTCVFCHGGDGVSGRGDRQRDPGLARALYFEARGQDGSAFRGWGPGRVDVTDAGRDNPTAIPDLFGVSQATWLNHSGVIRVTGRSTLAVRFETQYILGHSLQRRPERALMWALAAYVVSLKPETPNGETSPQGAEVFAKNCAVCHVPARGYAGGLVPASTLAVDPRVADDLERGTGNYKVPSLLGVRHHAPYLHDGSQPDLASLLASGHPSGADLSDAERSLLLSFLETL